jgi:alkanesulfonate monooxygenase SsuD/methylene tetrahydromethanopterin reductase-like flavin-dependent oxidoreductase (luciferase family)
MLQDVPTTIAYGASNRDSQQLMACVCVLLGYLALLVLAEPGLAVRVQPPLGPDGMVVWVGVGGSPDSVVRVVRQDLQLMLAIIGGDPRRFLPYIELYHRACAQLERPLRPVGVHSPGFVAKTDTEAREALWPHYQEMFGRIGRERGWPPTTKDRYLAEVEHGSLYVGSVETVARKIAATVRDLGLQRFDMKYSTGPMPHAALVDCIGLYGDKVIPMVRDLLSADPRH